MCQNRPLGTIWPWLWQSARDLGFQAMKVSKVEGLYSIKVNSKTPKWTSRVIGFHQLSAGLLQLQKAAAGISHDDQRPPQKPQPLLWEKQSDL